MLMEMLNRSRGAQGDAEQEQECSGLLLETE